jgi:hypothetical protein
MEMQDVVIRVITVILGWGAILLLVYFLIWLNERKDVRQYILWFIRINAVRLLLIAVSVLSIVTLSTLDIPNLNSGDSRVKLMVVVGCLFVQVITAVYLILKKHGNK